MKSKDNCAIIYHTITHCSYTESKDNNECINNTYAELKEVRDVLNILYSLYFLYNVIIIEYYYYYYSAECFK